MTHILTDLTFLDEGKNWPPLSQSARLRRYAKNQAIYGGAGMPSARRVNQFMLEQDIKGGRWGWHKKTYQTVLNYQRKISLKTADFLFQEPPTYGATDIDQNKPVRLSLSERLRGLFIKDKEQDVRQLTLDEIVRFSSLNKRGYSAAIDTSRFGDSIFIVRIVNGKGKVTISQPDFWFPVMQPDDISEIQFQVIAWTTDLPDEGDVKHRKKLTYQIHSAGKYVTASRLVVGTGREAKIKGFIDTETTIETKFSGIAVKPVQNVVTSDTVYADDDYTDVNGIVSEIETRYSQIAKILDKHADPNMTGSSDALTFDAETGEYTLKSGNFFPVEQGGEKMSYVTWDGQLVAAFSEIEKLTRALGVISEMGPSIFDSDISTSSNLSGRALRFLFVNVLAKVARIRNSFDEKFPKLLAMASEVGYDAVLTERDIFITWQDGLPNDPKEMAETEQIRLGSKANQTLVASIMMLDGLDHDQAQEKADQIAMDERDRMFGFGGMPDQRLDPPAEEDLESEETE